MPTIKLSDTETLQVIHHLNNLDMVKHLAEKLKVAINNKGKEGTPGPAPAHDHTDGMTRQKIANALGMPWGATTTTDAILEFINKNCTRGAAQIIKDYKRDLEKEVEVNKYLRDNLQEIGKALELDNLTPAYVTEAVLVKLKEIENAPCYALQLDAVKGILGDLHTSYVGDILGRLHKELGMPVPSSLSRAPSAAIADGDQVLQLEADNRRLQRKLSDLKDIVNKYPRSSNSDWARIQEILG